MRHKDSMEVPKKPVPATPVAGGNSSTTSAADSARDGAEGRKRDAGPAGVAASQDAAWTESSGELQDGLHVTDFSATLSSDLIDSLFKK